MKMRERLSRHGTQTGLKTQWWKILHDGVVSLLVSDYPASRKKCWCTRILGFSQPKPSKNEPKGKGESPEVKLKKNKKGYPILPSVEEIDGLTLIDKKKLIGRFMGDVYGALAADPCRWFIHWAYFQISPSVHQREEYPGRNWKGRQATTLSPSICWRRLSYSSNTITFAWRTSIPCSNTGRRGKPPIRFHCAS